MIVDKMPGELVALSKQQIDSGSPLPRHAQVKAILLSAVNSGTWEPGTKIPAETDIARVLKVSKMTANRAITDLASEGVLVRHLGRGTFVKNRVLQSNTRDHDRSVVRSAAILRVVTSGPASDVADNEYLCSLLLAIRTAVSPYEAVIKISQITGCEYTSAFEQLPSESWIIIAPNRDDVDGLRALSRMHRNAVVLGASWPDTGVPSVDSDNRGGVALAIEHLAMLGHTSIGMLYADPDTSNTLDRVSGFYSAMKLAGLSVNQRFVLDAHDDMGIRPDIQSELAHILKSSERPTAWLAAGPYVAMSLFDLATHLGLEVPHDLSIIGFDYPTALATASSSLSTVCQPLNEMGVAAARLAMNVPGGEPVCKMPCSLALRGSTSVPCSIVKM